MQRDYRNEADRRQIEDRLSWSGLLIMAVIFGGLLYLKFD